MTERTPLPLTAAWYWTTRLSTLLIVAGGVGALAGGTSWVWVLVGGLGFRVAAEIAIAIVAYRRTMSRPWPRVAPLADDDWD